MILLREGLEALLIVATLLSFLKRVHQSDKQKWIWVGVVAGLAASIALSIIISFIFSQVSAAIKPRIFGRYDRNRSGCDDADGRGLASQ